jgi:hypothetical protein
MDSENPTTDLLNILSKAMDGKVYGSIEIFLEEGQITQISQRVIKKIKKTQTSHSIIKKPSPVRKANGNPLGVTTSPTRP